MSLSAIVIAYNEEKNIGACLEALKFADEIVVVDSESTDKTVEVAESFTKKVYRRKFDNFSGQKNFALENATSDWILSVDADERVSAPLLREIEEAIQKEAGFDAYKIKRKTKLFGRFFSYSGLQQDKPTRLFKRQGARFERPIHEVVKVQGSVGILKESLLHESFQTMSDYFRRLQFYTKMETSSPASGISQRHFLLRPLHRFLSIYFWKQGFRDGLEGFLYATLSGYYEFLRWAKIWEKNRESHLS